MKAGKGVGQERRGGIGLGIHGVGIEFEREKGISRVEFHPHHHRGRGGQGPGVQNQTEPPDLAKCCARDSSVPALEFSMRFDRERADDQVVAGRFLDRNEFDADSQIGDLGLLVDGMGVVEDVLRGSEMGY